MADAKDAMDDGPTRVIGMRADYWDSHRQSIPRTVLANSYIAFKSVFQQADFNSVDSKGQITITTSNIDYNQLLFWSPAFTVAQCTNETFHTACWNAYEEFRIRCMKVTLHSMEERGFSVGGTVTRPLHSWFWYPENHSNLNPGNELGNYTDMIESGERVYPAGKHYSDTLTMRFVPQCLVNVGPADPVGAGVFKDIQAPWLPTNAANRAATYYAPYFIWRKPYLDAVPFDICKYTPVFSCIVEFRNPKDDQL